MEVLSRGKMGLREKRMDFPQSHFLYAVQFFWRFNRAEPDFCLDKCRLIIGKKQEGIWQKHCT